ncbi:hypothetical protein N0V88_007108 [Collariella sp. IMI 366227]|nr:hypothetical protein N0V88_007108 [Collariella sp. IMI 366227]
MAVVPRRPHHGDVLDIPTPPLQQAALFVIFFFTAIAFVSFSLRAFTRMKLQQWGIDDYLVSAGMLFSILMIGPFYMFIKLAYFGWKKKDVSSFNPAAGQWWFYLAQLFYNPTLAFVKASILCFLHRLGANKPGLKWVIHGLNTFNALQAVATFLVSILQCLPVEAYWNASLRAESGTKCIDNSFQIVISCLTIFTDLCVVALPFWIFLGLKMPRSTKINVLGIFALNLVVTIIAIARLHGIVKQFYLPHPADEDPTTTLLRRSQPRHRRRLRPALRPLFRDLLPHGAHADHFDGGNRDLIPHSNNTPYMGSCVATRERGPNYPMRNADGSLTLQAPRRGEIRLKKLRGGHAECRSASPSGSQEEIMTYDGIMKTTHVRVQVHFEGENGTIMGDEESRASSELKSVMRSEKT